MSAASASVVDGIALIEDEAIFVDEQRWDDWLALYLPECEYWMPAWKADGTIGTDPRTELSHIYYASRAGLEDRVARIRSGRSAASTPAPRSLHLLGQIRALDTAPDRIRLRSSWATQVFFPRSRATHAFFGRAEHELVRRDGTWKIAKKKIEMQNDYIPTMLDIYCV
jgi:3-phenylpropionate/cinnamic acid dioxygenase small subunit